MNIVFYNDKFKINSKEFTRNFSLYKIKNGNCNMTNLI